MQPPPDNEIRAHDELAADFGKLLIGGELTDISIVVNNASTQNVEVVRKAHSLILAARSEHFSNLLQSGMEESLTHRIQIPDAPLDAVDAFLKYIYTGEVVVTGESLVLHLYTLADQFIMDGLKKLMLEKLWAWLDSSTIVPMLVEAQDIGVEPKLLNLLLSFAAGHIGEIAQKDFNTLSLDLVVSILQCTSLSAREADILSLVCSWARNIVDTELEYHAAQMIQSFMYVRHKIRQRHKKRQTSTTPTTTSTPTTNNTQPTPAPECQQPTCSPPDDSTCASSTPNVNTPLTPPRSIELDLEQESNKKCATTQRCIPLHSNNLTGNVNVEGVARSQQPSSSSSTSSTSDTTTTTQTVDSGDPPETDQHLGFLLTDTETPLELSSALALAISTSMNKPGGSIQHNTITPTCTFPLNSSEVLQLAPNDGTGSESQSNNLSAPRSRTCSTLSTNNNSNGTGQDTPPDDCMDNHSDEQERGGPGDFPCNTPQHLPTPHLRQKKLELLKCTLEQPLRHIRFALLNKRDLIRLADMYKIRIVTNETALDREGKNAPVGCRRAFKSCVPLHLSLAGVDRAEKNFEYNGFKFKIAAVKTNNALGIYLHFQYDTYPALFVINAQGITITLYSTKDKSKKKYRTLDNKIGLGKYGLGYKTFLIGKEFAEFLDETESIELDVDYPFYNNRKLHLHSPEAANQESTIPF